MRNPHSKIVKITSYKDIQQDIITQDDFILIKYRGQFLDKCPGTKKHICCNYYVINWAMGCPYNCTYCYLHGYQNFPGIILHANMGDMIREVTEVVSKHPNQFFRIGTGEFADSMAIEKETGFNELVLPELLKLPNVIIELKTKCADLLPELGAIVPDLKQKLVFAWSFNTPTIIAQEELGASTLSQRLKSAKSCQDAGFQIALHFDPVIYYENWEAEYQQTIKQIFQVVNPVQIAWISIGALRFNPKVKKAALAKFPQTKIYYGELLPGVDGKMRYFQPLRTQMLKQIYAWIKESAPIALIYLCMESPEVWQEVIGDSNPAKSKLGSLFERCVQT